MMIALLLASLTFATAAPSADTVGTRDLPIVVIPAIGEGQRMAVFITGDGGYVPADRSLAEELARHGVAVVALNVRAYLSHKRTPDEAARDVARIARTYGARWHRDRLVLVGYSRGADMLPFIANRLPADLHQKIDLVALFSIAPRASFEFHWRDLLFEPSRATDLPVLPELEKLRGTPLLCAYGDDEKEPMCRSLDPTLAKVVSHVGEHRISRKTATELARLVLDALK